MRTSSTGSSTCRPVVKRRKSTNSTASAARGGRGSQSAAAAAAAARLSYSAPETDELDDDDGDSDDDQNRAGAYEYDDDDDDVFFNEEDVQLPDGHNGRRPISLDRITDGARSLLSLSSPPPDPAPGMPALQAAVGLRIDRRDAELSSERRRVSIAEGAIKDFEVELHKTQSQLDKAEKARDGLQSVLEVEGGRLRRVQELLEAEQSRNSAQVAAIKDLKVKLSKREAQLMRYKVKLGQTEDLDDSTGQSDSSSNEGGGGAAGGLIPRSRPAFTAAGPANGIST